MSVFHVKGFFVFAARLTASVVYNQIHFLAFLKLFYYGVEYIGELVFFAVNNGKALKEGVTANIDKCPH